MAVSISIGITQNSQNIANNTSNITVKVNISWTLGSWNQENPAPSGWLKIDGVTYSFASTFNPNRTTAGSQTLYTKTVTISHNSDGSKTVSCSASFASGVSSGTVTASGSKALTTIPRATKPTVNVSSADMGTKVTISCPRASSSFTHDLSYKIPGDSDYIAIASGVGTSYSWTVPDRATSIPTSTGVQMTLRCITRSGSTTVGTAYAYITANVPSSVVPTVDTVTTSEIVSGLAAQFQAYVQSKSKIRVSISASGAKGSTIQEYSSTFAGKTYSGSTWTSDTLSNAGQLTIKTRVKDSRGRWSEYKDTTILVEEYSNPQIRSMTAYRCNSAGAADDEGIYLAISYDYSVASVGGKNTASATIKYKLSTQTSYSATLLTLTALAESTTYKPASPTFSVDNSYHFEMIVEDWFGATATSVTVLPSGKVILDIKANGLGLGIGKVAETDGVCIGWYLEVQDVAANDITANHVEAESMDVAIGLTVFGKPLLDIIYPVGSIYMSVNNTDPGTIFGGTWKRFAEGKTLIGVDSSDSDFNAPNKSGGEKTHALTENEMPKHEHYAREYGNTNHVYIRKPSTSGGTYAVSTTVFQGVNYGGSTVTGRLMTVPTGGGASHNNMPPYITCYMWVRTA